MIVLSSRLDRPETKLLYQDLRRDPRTAQTPIIILAEEDELPNLREMIGADLLSSAVFRPRDLAGMQFVVEGAGPRRRPHLARRSSRAAGQGVIEVDG